MLTGPTHCGRGHPWASDELAMMRKQVSSTPLRPHHQLLPPGSCPDFLQWRNKMLKGTMKPFLPNLLLVKVFHQSNSNPKTYRERMSKSSMFKKLHRWLDTLFTVNNKFHSIKCAGLFSKSLALLPFHSIIKYFLSFYYELIILSIIREFSSWLNLISYLQLLCKIYMLSMCWTKSP